tara:strand:+ start:1498 stop:1878 length:381 start_codon:yes stop_codon:yes gene_type:complete
MSKNKKELNLIKRSLKNGFDLSSLPNYTPASFRAGLFEFLVGQSYVVFEEDEIIYVGYDLLQDIAEITVIDTTMRIKPIASEGFFNILIDLFRYIGMLTDKKDSTDDDVSTESYSSEESSEEELWL